MSLAGFFPFLLIFFGNQLALCFASKCTGHWSSKQAVQLSPRCNAFFFAFRCSFVSTGPEYGRLVGLTSRERNLSSFHPSWTVAGGGVVVFSPLAGGGSEVYLVMVTCTQSGFPGEL